MKNATNTAEKMKEAVTISDLCGVAVKASLLIKLGLADGQTEEWKKACEEFVIEGFPVVIKLLEHRTIHALTPDCPASHMNKAPVGSKVPCAEFLIPLEDQTELHVMAGLETWNRITQLLTDAMVAMPADVSKGGFNYEGEA